MSADIPAAPDPDIAALPVIDAAAAVLAAQLWPEIEEHLRETSA